MTLAQRSPAATSPVRSSAAPLPRQAGYGQQFRTQPPGARQPGAAPRPLAAHPTQTQPMAPRPMTGQPAPRAAVTFLTVAEVAAMMRVSKMTVYRLVHGGEMAAVRVGRSFRVPATAVRTYLDDARTDAA
ncbi:excisionase family DNA-binding protein [Modestobacter sp. VKM Ac-2978]|uniref:helix-turn-helix domain-containing protein n=1 Tax=Modestobacter sp. VKM Ac-2978 TaxID=3004132 RepID=UPI003FA540D4